MGRRIDLPKSPSGEPEQQLQQLYSYLYQMAEALNNNLAEIGGSDLTDRERAEIREVIGTGDANADRNEAETLKSLIIKTASFVQSSLNEYRTKLLGEYVAEGKFGKYVRRTGLDVDVTPSGITQNYTLQEIIQGLKTYEVNAKNYIKTGYLRTESSLPVYGVAIGKDVVTFSEDGTETYNDGNKVAELTADELSFWQNQQKIASYKGNRISFFYNGAEAFYISAGKIYCTNDLELSSGKKLIINTENFSIDSSGNVALKGAAEILSGKSLKVKSGGSLQVESGGNIDINASGNLKLSGSAVEIKSGSTFDVDSENMVINSDTGYLSVIRNYNGNDVKLTIGDYMPYSAGMYANIYPSSWGFGSNQDSYGVTYSLFDKLTKPGTTYNNYMYMGVSFINYPRNSATPTKYTVPGIRVVGVSDDNTFGGGVFAGIAQIDIIESNILRSVDIYYGALNQASSKEIKHNIQPMEPAGEKLDRLQPVTFVYDDDPDEKVRAGLIYEDTVEVMPEICTGDESNKAISYMELVPMLLKEIQDLRARVKALEEREGGQ